MSSGVSVLCGGQFVPLGDDPRSYNIRFLLCTCTAESKHHIHKNWFFPSIYKRGYICVRYHSAPTNWEINHQNIYNLLLSNFNLIITELNLNNYILRIVASAYGIYSVHSLQFGSHFWWLRNVLLIFSSVKWLKKSGLVVLKIRPRVLCETYLILRVCKL